MNKVLVLVVGTLLIIIGVIFIITNQQDPTSNIVAVVNNKTYTITQFETDYNLEILDSNSTKVKVSNHDTYYECYYNQACEIWPDSQNGTIMWEAPLVYVTFKKK